jgi:hypothetical protein
MNQKGSMCPYCRLDFNRVICNDISAAFEHGVASRRITAFGQTLTILPVCSSSVFLSLALSAAEPQSALIETEVSNAARTARFC